MVTNLKDEIALELDNKERARELARIKYEHDRQTRWERLPKRTEIIKTQGGAILSIGPGPRFNPVAWFLSGLVAMMVVPIGMSLLAQDRFPWILVPITVVLFVLPFLCRARPLKVQVVDGYFAIYRRNPKRRLAVGRHQDLVFFWDKYSFREAMAIRGGGRRFSVPYFSNHDAKVVNRFCREVMGRDHDELGL